MDKKIFQVYLAKRDVPDSEAYAQLDLPARPWELIDALDKVRLAGDETLFLEIEDYYDYEELLPHLAEEIISLNELNALAQNLSELSSGQHTAFDGLLQMEVDKRTGPISVQTLRNLAASADCCHVVGEALNDSQLGRFYAENGFIPEIETISDKVFEMLDFEAIGRKMRLGDCGVFTPHGYVAQNADLELTSPVPADVPVPNYSILLRVSKGYFNDPAYDNDKTVLLKLPAGPDQADAVVEELGAASWKELGWRCLDCRIPTLADAITDAEDFSAVDLLAKKLMDMETKNIPRYKAVLSATDCKDINQALQYAESLDQYILSPGISGPRELARQEVELMASDKDAELLLKHLNLYAYGRELLEQDPAILTEYGLLERQDGEPIQRLDQPAQGGMKMR